MASSLHWQGTVIHKDAMPAELKSAAAESDVMGWASAEIEDSDGDVVRVDGISLERHTSAKPLKLLASHLKVLPSGESPIIGHITSFSRCRHPSGVKGLAFGADFAKTNLGEQYKILYQTDDGKNAPDFSIGFKPTKAEPLKGGSGLDYTGSILMEISAVTIPANSLATILRALEQDHPGSGSDPSAAAMFATVIERMDNLESALSAVVKASVGDRAARAFVKAANDDDDDFDYGEDDDDGKAQLDLKKLQVALDSLKRSFKR